MKIILKSHILFFIVIAFFAEPSNGQVKDSLKKSFDAYKLFEKKTRVFSGDQIDSLINEDSFAKVIFTGFGDRIVKNVFNGMRFSAVYGQSEYSLSKINEASYMPIWNEDPSEFNYGAELSFAILPFELDLGANYSEIKLEELNKNFPIPPQRPSGQKFENKLKVINAYASINWIPFIMSFRPAIYFGYEDPALYFIPFVGGNINYTDFNFNDKHNRYYSKSMNVGMKIRYRLFFVSFNMKNYIFEEEALKNEFQIKTGIWFSLTK